jgi:3-isopropylmalate dehydratase small subunit
MTSRGRVWKFGNDVNTDLIIPGRHLSSYDPAHLAKHAMEGVSKDFATSVSKGDIIVAGANFGCGSSREQAVVALKQAGVGAVVAKSFARIFYRNSINLGLPVYVSETAFDILTDGEIVAIDAKAGVISSQDAAKKATIEPMPEHLREIVDSGGLVPHLRKTVRPK